MAAQLVHDVGELSGVGELQLAWPRQVDVSLDDEAPRLLAPGVLRAPLRVSAADVSVHTHSKPHKQVGKGQSRSKTTSNRNNQVSHRRRPGTRMAAVVTALAARTPRQVVGILSDQGSKT